jgi:hypothetical protein
MWSKYNIDALKHDGGFNKAGYKWIAGSLGCGHTAHLETEHGVVAFRPFRDRDTNKQWWRLDFYGPYQDDIANRDSENIQSDDRLALIRWAFEKLNGSMDTWFEPNDTFEVWSNQAERPACVLATIGDEVLIEYEMPGTTSKWRGHPAEPTSSLRVIKTIGLEIVGDYRSVSYKTVPKRWLRAIKEAGTTEWIGMAQASFKKERIPFPEII